MNVPGRSDIVTSRSAEMVTWAKVEPLLGDDNKTTGSSSSSSDTTSTTTLGSSSNYKPFSSSDSAMLLTPPKPAWYMTIDWSTIGYWLFLAGSILYIAQASIPYYSYYSSVPPSYNATAAAKANDESYYYALDDGYEAPYYSKNASGWEGLWAAIIFEIESIIYIFGWWVARESERQHNKTPMIWWKDWNFHGNTLFFIGSTGYLIVAYWALESSHYEESDVGLLAMAVVFIFDSWFYFFALLGGAHSRAGRPHGAHGAHNYVFVSEIDYYFFASILFIVGSVVYVVAAVQAHRGESADVMNMLGAVIFVVDSLLYLMSGYQQRDTEEDEAPVQRLKSRRSIHLVSKKASGAAVHQS